MKKLCFITQCSLPIPTVKGGAVETLVEYLLDENEKNPNFEITVLSVDDLKAREKSKAYKHSSFVYIPQQKVSYNKILLQIYRVFKHLGIYIPFSLEFNEALKVLSRLEKHDYYIFEAGPTTQLPALQNIVPKEKLLVHIHWDGMGNKKKDKCFSYLFPVSDYIGSRWYACTGCDKEKIRPLYNCARIERFTKKLTEEEKAELRQKLNIPGDHAIVIFTGRIVWEKGVKELLQAVNMLYHEKVTLLVIGSANFGASTNTPYEKEVNQLISNISRQVVFTGFVHQTELYKYYNIADIAVMPSLFQDPAPLVCIETQATGTPLIATKVGGIPEYTTEDTAILIPADKNLPNSLAEKIDFLIDNPDIRFKMGQAAEQHAQKFSVESYYNNFCQLISSLDCEQD